MQNKSPSDFLPIGHPASPARSVAAQASSGTQEVMPAVASAKSRRCSVTPPTDWSTFGCIDYASLKLHRQTACLLITEKVLQFYGAEINRRHHHHHHHHKNLQQTLRPASSQRLIVRRSRLRTAGCRAFGAAAHRLRNSRRCHFTVAGNCQGMAKIFLFKQSHH